MTSFRPSAIALTGATGRLGRSLLAELADCQPDVRLVLLVRRRSPRFRDAAFQRLLGRFSGEIRIVESEFPSLRLSDADRDALTGADGGLWHLAASTNLSRHAPGVAYEARLINEEGTVRLLELCFERPPAALHYVSTAYVAGARQGRVLEGDLNTDGPFRNSYEQSKAAAEGAVRQAIARGLAGTIFRPSLILEEAESADGHSVAHAFAVAVAGALRRRKRELVLRLPPESGMNMVSDRFVCRAMLSLAAGVPRALCYHLTADRETSLGQLAEILAHTLPGFRLRFDPSIAPRQLDAASLLLDRMLEDLRPYCTSGLSFDRTNTDRDLEQDMFHEIDWSTLAEKRLKQVGVPLCTLAQ
jgi:nucleoside-diphosphate-sugar epimerase